MKVIKVEPFNLSINSLKSKKSNTWLFLIFFSLIIFLILSFLVNNNNCLFFPIINLELGIGLVGLSYPLIFNNQATFSGALINR